MANRRLPDVSKPADSVQVTSPAATRRASRTRKSLADTPARARVTPEARRALIAETAYLRAERRGFAPGQETEDWMAAEAEVDALLKEGGSPQ